MQSRHDFPILTAGLCLLIACGTSVQGDGILVPGEREHIAEALDYLNMTTNDMGFAKDHVEPELYLENVRNFLHEPLGLPDMAERIRDVATNGSGSNTWKLVAELLEVPQTPLLLPVPEDLVPTAWDELDPELSQAIAAFIRDAEHAYANLDVAFEQLSPEVRSELAATELTSMFTAEDRPEVRDALVDMGLARTEIDRAIEESLVIDPEPRSTNYINHIASVDRIGLVEAGRLFAEGVKKLARVVAASDSWPDKPQQLPTPFGTIYLGSKGDDTYEQPALLVIDPAGNDTYGKEAGSANGIKGTGLAGIIDLEGEDLYRGEEILGPGASLFGVSAILDREGDDIYRSDYIGQAGALYGAAWLEDLGGSDTYRSYALSQAAASVGVAVLRDEAGNDLYDVGFQGQGFSGLYGVGLLIDGSGNDRYIAGGREPDYERHPDRFLSLSQGFSIGMRPYAGGGVAALVDLAGNDTYVADIYGQGVSYWYSAGFLLDAEGNDTYHVHHYGQGSGIHLSSGLLWDGAGNDKYTGYILAQGNAHDYAVGMLFDKEGDDTYTADHHAQGRAINNSLAILMDSAGNDGYLARNNEECQGIGNPGGNREYGSLSLLLDLDGRDFYSCGAEDGVRMQRPLYGIIYDVKKETAEE